MRIGGKATPPQVMAQQNSFWAVPFTLLGRKHTAQLRLYAEDWKEILRDRERVQPLHCPIHIQLAVADSIEREVRSDIGKRLVPLFEGEEWKHLQRLSGES